MLRLQHTLPMLLALVLTTASAQAGNPPVISSTSDASLDRSGRLLVFGSEFGSPGPGSRLEIDGIEAIATTWLAGEIHAYVPEVASLGTVTVQVVTPNGASNTVGLTVTPRTPDGRVNWRFQLDSNYAGNDVALGPSGEVYVSDDLRLYAFAPGGGLQWVLEGGGSGLPIAVAADGTIYSYSQGLNAIDPSGALLWKFVPPNPQEMIVAGPNLGPDGNLYLVQDTTANGLGVFSVDPAGNLRWSDPGNPAVFNMGGSGNTHVRFGSLSNDRLVFGNSASLQGQAPLLYGFDLSGNQKWTYGDGCTTFPRIDPSGRVVFARFQSCGVTVLDIDDASLVWNAPPPTPIVSTVGAAVASDGMIYSGDFVGKLWAVRPDGTTKYFVPAPFVVSKLGISPDSQNLVEGQFELRGYDTADGSLQWIVDLPDEQGFAQLINTSDGPEFTSDSSTAFVTTRFTGNGPGYSYLYAVSVTDGKSIGTNYCGPANINSSGQSAVITGFGSNVATDDDLTLTASQLPPNKFGYFLNSNQQGFTPFPPGSSGNLCLGGGIGRHAKQVANSGAIGEIVLTVDLTALPRPNGTHSVVAGETWNFQCWFRDNNPNPTSNFTDGLSVTFL